MAVISEPSILSYAYPLYNPFKKLVGMYIVLMLKKTEGQPRTWAILWASKNRQLLNFAGWIYKHSWKKLWGSVIQRASMSSSENLLQKAISFYLQPMLSIPEEMLCYF